MRTHEPPIGGDGFVVDSAKAKVGNLHALLGFACSVAAPLLTLMAVWTDPLRDPTRGDWLGGNLSGIASVGSFFACLGGLTLCASAFHKWRHITMWSRGAAVAGFVAAVALGVVFLVGTYLFVTSFG